MAGFLAGLKERAVRYSALRWFEALPDLPPGADLDLLVADEDLARLREALGGRPGTIPLDVYTAHGSGGHEWRGASYYPPALAHRILAASRENARGVRVPAPEHAFLSLAFHAVYHKGPASGLPAAAPGGRPRPDPRHDYRAALGEMARALGWAPSLTMEGLDDFLGAQGWRPPRDTLRKWSRVNPWLRRRYFAARAPDEPAGLAAFVLRRAAVELDLVGELVGLIRAHGFTVLDLKRLAAEEVERVAQGTRGGNWAPGGGFTAAGGPPAVLVVAHDPRPARLTRRYRRRYPDMDNGRLVCKRAIRDEINRRFPASRRANLLHVSDNASEAWEYIRLACPEREEAIRARIAAFSR
ncbi:MAG: hypothetical protein AB1726_05760 [Planctomycetota bacterium]